MGAVYLSKIIGTGDSEDPFRPALMEVLGIMQAIDGRADATSPDGFMIVFCEPTAEQHDAIVADPRNTYLVA